jgi:hypothetical protein
MPFESGTGSSAGFGAFVDTAPLPLAAGLGRIQLVTIGAAQANQSAAQTNPAATVMTSTSTTASGDLMMMSQTGLGPGALSLGAPEGLVHVTGFQATASANAAASGGGSVLTPSPTQPLTIRIWPAGSFANLTDPDGVPVVCDQISGGYCVLTPTPQTHRTVQVRADLCLGGIAPACLVKAHVETTVNVRAVSQQAATEPDALTKVWSVDYSPATITARLTVSNAGVTVNLLDARATADLGRVFSCAKFGLLNGSCP